MAGVVTQSDNDDTVAAGGQTLTLSLTGVAAGATLAVIGFSWKSGVGTQPSAAEMSDTQSGAWTRIDYWGSGTPKVWCFYRYNVSSGNITVTLDRGSTGWHMAATLVEMPAISGFADPFDKQSGVDSGGATTTPTMGSQTPAQADSVYLGVITARSGGWTSITVPTGYTAFQTFVSSNQDGQTCYKVLSSTAAEAPSWTVNDTDTASMQGLIFKTAAAGGGGGGTLPPSIHVRQAVSRAAYM